MADKRVCIATGTRADWGILTPVARELQNTPGVDVVVLATNMHLMERYGHTVDEIRAAGFRVGAEVVMDDGDSQSALSRAEAMGQCLSGCARALAEMKPDAVVILGDRFEMLAVASACTLLRIPIIHLCGGEISEGAIDDSLRHAITKLASLHLVATDEYRNRVIQLGEQPDKVINVGSPGVWNLLHQPLMGGDELRQELEIAPGQELVVATFHPATLDDGSPGEQCRRMLMALDRYPRLHTIITYPNNDAGSAEIVAEIERYAAEHPERVSLVRSLGMRRYLGAVKAARFVIGNSSSGIIEVPSAGTPVVNIGSRQDGRMRSALVIDCQPTTEAICQAIDLALDNDFVKIASKAPNPYFKHDTPQLCVRAIIDFINTPYAPKKFYNLPQ